MQYAGLQYRVAVVHPASNIHVDRTKLCGLAEIVLNRLFTFFGCIQHTDDVFT